jgi:hypothetical protein
MDTIVLRTVSFFSQTIRAHRTKAAFPRSQGHESTLSPTPVAQEPLAALVQVEAPPNGMVGATGTTMAGCSVTGNLPLFLWQDATMIPEDTDKTRSWRGIVPHINWEQLALLRLIGRY